MADVNLQALISALHAYGIELEPASTTSSNESPSGTVITPGTGSITDSNNTAWSINSSGVIVRDSAADTSTAAVIKIEYLNKVIYQENKANNWWSWTSNAWQATAAPK